MQLSDLLFSQGFGTRKECQSLIHQGFVSVPSVYLKFATCRAHTQKGEWSTITDLQTNFDIETIACTPFDFLNIPNINNQFTFKVRDLIWQYHKKAYIMINKPIFYECSHKPSAYPSIYTLLPPPLRQRPNKNAVLGVQAIGRLDCDTTGLLLFSDDGQFIHRMASPKHRQSKVYDVTCKHTVTSSQITKLIEGVVLRDGPEILNATACEPLDDYKIRLTITQGKYHQVKRMIAAVGNRVHALHRTSIGTLMLPDDLAPSQWRWLNMQQIHQLGIV